ncbi:hypothetical protein U1Q18_022352 [Sarracenia purpurea var. burkii]
MTSNAYPPGSSTLLQSPSILTNSSTGSTTPLQSPNPAPTTIHLRDPAPVNPPPFTAPVNPPPFTAPIRPPFIAHVISPSFMESTTATCSSPANSHPMVTRAKDRSITV